MNLEKMPVEAIEAIMDTLPVDLSFVDAEDTVVFFNNPAEGRIFPRTKMDLGRKVQNCHPPKSLDTVNRILTDFKNGKRDKAPFWIDLNGRKVLIEYFPVRDKSGKYLGTIEVTRDITDIQKMQGQKRLLDE